MELEDLVQRGCDMSALNSIRNLVNQKVDKGEKFFSSKSFPEFTSQHVSDTITQLRVLGYVKEWEGHLFKIIKRIPEELSAYQLRKIYDEKRCI